MTLAEFTAPGMGTHKLEISNDDEFIRRYKEVNKKARKKGVKDVEKCWKIKHLGDKSRVPAAIQRLIDASQGIVTPMSQLAAPGLDEALLPETTNTVVEEAPGIPMANGKKEYMENGGEKLDEAIKDLEAVQSEFAKDCPHCNEPLDIAEGSDDCEHCGKNLWREPETQAEEQIEGEIKPRERPKINPFTGEPV